MKAGKYWIKPVRSGGGGGEYPDQGLPPVEPGEPEPEPPEVGEPGFPTPPIHIPELPEIPVHPLPPTEPPAIGDGKPAGIPTLPWDPNWKAPTSGPHGPGTWVTINAGHGQPPAWAFIPKDDGLGGGSEPPVPTPKPAGAAGHWVPVGKQPKAADPVWAWVPEIGPQFGVKPPLPQPK